MCVYVSVCVCMWVCVYMSAQPFQSCTTLCDPVDCSLPGYLPDPGIEPMIPASPALQADSFSRWATQKPHIGSRRSPGWGHGNPFWYSCLENPMDRGTWQAAVHGVTKSWTQLSAQSPHEGPTIMSSANPNSLPSPNNITWGFRASTYTTQPIAKFPYHIRESQKDLKLLFQGHFLLEQVESSST